MLGMLLRLLSKGRNYLWGFDEEMICLYWGYQLLDSCEPQRNSILVTYLENEYIFKKYFYILL